MSQKLLEAVAQNTRLRLLHVLKRTQGLDVQELAERLAMSYMGVKDACLDLEKRGLVEARREPKPAGVTGRPRLRYQLTGRAHGLFPEASNSLTLELLEATKKLFGPAAAEKLLLVVWQQKAVALASRMSGESLAERAGALARLRDLDSHMATAEAGEGLRIIEHHCPFLDVLRAYPLVAKLETDLFQRLLAAPVRREEVLAGELMHCVFHLG
jgi:predicted ArsR family transcriptional regulator